MRERLTYAITECQVIDTDYLPRERSEWDHSEGDEDNDSSGEYDRW